MADQETFSNVQPVQQETFSDVKPISTVGGAGGSWEPQSTTEKSEGIVSKVWEGANKPLVSEDGLEHRARAYSESAPTLSDTEHPTMTGVKKGLAGAYADTAETLRGFTSPLAIGMVGAGKLAGEIPGAAGKIVRAGSKLAGLGFGAAGAEQAVQGAEDISKQGVTPENLKQTLGGAGFGVLGATGALHGTEAGEAPAVKTLAAPVRGTAKLARPAGQVIPRIGGIAILEALGVPHAWLLGGALGTHVLPPEIVENLFEKGRTLGLNDEEANIAHLQDRYNEALKKAKVPEREYQAHEAGRQQGIPAPEDVLKAHEKAQTLLQAAKDHLLAAQKDYATKIQDKGVTPSTGPIELSPEQKLAQDTRQTPSPTDADIQARQEKLMSDMEAKVGMEKPKVEPEVPAAPKPKAPPIMTAGAPERAPSMRVLKVDEHGKVIDTTAAESAAREALGVESPARQVPATEGIATPAGGAPRMRTPFAKEEPAPAPQIPVRRETPVAEAPKVEAPKADVPKEAPERSPEDLSKVDTVVKELPNQDLIRHGSRFGIDETKYDFSKRVALREGGSKHPVEREAYANATLAALPEDLKNHIVDAANAWDAKNPKIFDPASYTNASRAERARAIMNEATKRYQDGLAAKGEGEGPGAPNKNEEGIGGMERWQGKNPLDKATVKPTADKVNLPADTDKEQPFEAGNQTWEDQLREARKTVNKEKAEAKAEKVEEDVKPARVSPAKLTDELSSDEGYVYHATNADRMQDVADSGKLDVHKPSHGTDQSSWPDGATEKRAYFSNKASIVWQFAPKEGKPVVLRTKGAGLNMESTGDVYSNKPITSDLLEYLGEDRDWHSVDSLKAEKPKEVGGGTDKPERGGTEEGAKQDTAYFAQAKRELPDGGISDWAKRAQELKDKGAEKADEVEFNPEKFRTQTLETPKEFKEKPEEPKGTKGHSYEYSKDGDTHQVTVRNKGGNSVASITAKETEGNPNVWQMKFSASDEKGEGLKGYKRLAEAAKAQAERENEPITLRGDDEMSAAARRTWVKMGDDYEVVWDKEHHPSITFKPTSEATPENASGAWTLWK